jgi:hypothetical protein
MNDAWRIAPATAESNLSIVGGSNLCSAKRSTSSGRETAASKRAPEIAGSSLGNDTDRSVPRRDKGTVTAELVADAASDNANIGAGIGSD